MKKWEELSENALDQMKFIGNFGPTVNVKYAEVKGYTYDEDGGGKCYLTSDDLRKLAAGCIEVADYLDERKKEPQ